MPTGYTPIYRILKDGIDITGHFNDRCLSIRIDYSGEDASDEDTCTITLDDRDFAIARPIEGETLNIEMGYAEIGLHDMGSYVMEEVHFTYPPKAIAIKGTASGSDTQMKQPITQEFKGQTLGKLFSQFAQKGGFGAKIHPDLASKTIDFLNAKGSAYQNIQELARANNAIAKIVKGTLQVVPRDKGESADGGSKPIIILRPEHFGTYDVKHANKGAYGKVKASYRDPSSYLPKFIEHGNEIPSMKNLPDFVINRLFASESEAKSAAQAQMGSLNKSLGEAHLSLAKGDPWIADQQRVMITGLRDGVNGSYVTSVVSHTYVKDQGIGTEILAKSPSDGGDYESQYQELGKAEKDLLFLDLGLGNPLGQALLDRFGQGSTAGNLLNGITPF